MSTSTAVETKNPLLAYFNQQVNDYVLSPGSGADMEIIRCLEMLTTSLGVSSELLSDVGRQLSSVWRKSACEVVPANCHLRHLAKNEYCSLSFCADQGMVHVQLHAFQVRLPVMAFLSICQAFMVAKHQLDECGSTSNVSSIGALLKRSSLLDHSTIKALRNT